MHIVCEVSDGLEAVQKAQELQPGLILLDVGLPTLTGIEAARQIREISPESKILFVSQEFSSDVVHEALSLGALGYILKTNAGIELLAAVEAVCQGRRFVSAGLAGYVPAELADRQAPMRFHPDEVLPRIAGEASLAKALLQTKGAGACVQCVHLIGAEIDHTIRNGRGR